MQTNSAVLAWLSRSSAAATHYPVDVNSQGNVRAPALRDPLTEVFVLREIFVAGIAREAGTKVAMQSSDALALSLSVPPTVEFIK